MNKDIKELRERLVEHYWDSDCSKEALEEETEMIIAILKAMKEEQEDIITEEEF